jgi:type IV pilus assembly protein PilX
MSERGEARARSARPRAPRGAPGRRQGGVSLLLVLVVLGVLLLAAAALLRNTETASLIAGNITFKQAALQAADIAVNEAVTDLTARADLDTTVPGTYMATRLATDANGLPANFDWSGVTSRTYGNLQLQWIVDRLCVAPLPVTNPIAQCQVNDLATTGSNKVGSPDYKSTTTYFYRVTVRARGPKNAESFVQSIVSR